jgi:hypothetical protein
LGDNIIDQTDVHVDSEHTTLVDRGSKAFEFARLKLLNTNIVNEMLSANEVGVITALLQTNKKTECFKSLTETQLTRLIATTPVTTFETAIQDSYEEDKVPKEVLYEKGAPHVTRLHWCFLVKSPC